MLNTVELVEMLERRLQKDVNEDAIIDSVIFDFNLATGMDRITVLTQGGKVYRAYSIYAIDGAVALDKIQLLPFQALQKREVKDA